MAAVEMKRRGSPVSEVHHSAELGGDVKAISVSLDSPMDRMAESDSVDTQRAERVTSLDYRRPQRHRSGI